tara:strand:+ start:2374 stop:3585 length:1212 start_codon:yes stop_codon:yes gene_type:complete
MTGIIKTDQLQGAQSTTVTIPSGTALNVTTVSGTPTFNGDVTLPSINGGQIGGRRNIIINGAMQVAQRGTSSTNSNTYGTVDRLDSRINGQDNAVTQAQVDVSSGTTPYSLGFRKAFKYTNGNQSSGAGATDYLFAFYKIEAQDIVNSGWDYTSSSSHITISFWVKASVSQNYYGYLRTPDGTAQKHSFETGTLTADTWTKVTKTFSGNSNITIDNDTGSGLVWYLAPFLGTNYTDNSASLTAWEAYSSGYTRTPDNTSTWWTTNNATLEFTGLQLEVGEQATPFEHRSFGEELSLCERYFQLFTHNGSGGGNIANGMVSAKRFYGVLQYKKDMRAIPTITTTSSGFNVSSSAHTIGSASIDETHNTTIHACRLRTTSDNGRTNGQAAILRFDSGSINIDAEL